MKNGNRYNRNSAHDGIVIVSFGNPADGADVRYACGHKDSYAVIFKVPERLHAFCRARDWLTDSLAWGLVVALYHARARGRGFRTLGFMSDECSACVGRRLREEMAALEAALVTQTAAASEAPPLKTAPRRNACKTKRQAIRHA